MLALRGRSAGVRSRLRFPSISSATTRAAGKIVRAGHRRSLLSPHGLLLLAYTSSIAACGPPPADNSRLHDRRFTYVIEETVAFGWFDLGDSVAPLSEIDRRVGAGVLSAPIDVWERDDGTVWVMDIDYQKVVVFGNDGSYQSVVPFSSGEGPGELTSPHSMTLTSDAIVILDRHHGSIIRYSLEGELLNAFRHGAGNPIEVLATDQTIYLLRFVPGGVNRPSVLAFGVDGQVVDSLFPHTHQDSELAVFGAWGAFGYQQNGEVVYAYPTPIEWEGAVSKTRTGTPMLARPAGFVVQHGQLAVQTPPVAVLSLAQDRLGRMLVLYQEFSPEGGSTQFLDVYSSDGSYSGSAELPDGAVYGRMSASRIGNHVYFTSHSDRTGAVRATLRSRR